MDLTNQYCYFYEDEKFNDTDRPGFRRRVINGELLQLCFWRISGGASGSVLHHHTQQEQIGVIVRSAALSFNCPQFGGLGPHVSIVVDPLKRPWKGGQLIELSIRATVTQPAPQLVEDDRTIGSTKARIDSGTRAGSRR